MILFTAIFFILFGFYFRFLLRIYRGLRRLTTGREDFPPVPVTIIVPFKNEENIILNCLNSLQKQDYPDELLEVIFVDDNSTDDSPGMLKRNIERENFKVIESEKNDLTTGHKKNAINTAINIACGEIIVTTDADCIHNKSWVSTLISCFDDNTGFVYGPIDYYVQDTYFSKFQQLDYRSLVISGAGLIGSGNPAVCGGANISYRKKVFHDVGGFSDNLHFSSGDDELLMQKIHSDTPFNVRFCSNIKAIVKTEPAKDFQEFINQRKRWASKSLFYKNTGLKLQLGLIFFFFLSIAIAFILGFAVSYFYHLILLPVYLLKILCDYLVIRKGLKVIYEDTVPEEFFVTNLLHIPYILVSSILGLFGNFTWKDRKLRR